MRAKSLLSCPNLCDPTDCGLPGSSVHGILQARIVEWVPPGDLPIPGIRPVSLKSHALVGGFFTTSAPWDALFNRQTFGNYLSPLVPDPSHHICTHSHKAPGDPKSPTSVYPGGSAHFLDHPRAPCACALHAPCDPAHYRPQLSGSQLAELNSCACAVRARRRLPEAPGR